MRTLNVPEWKDFIRYVAVEQDEAVFGWGAPGCGKTEGAAQVAREDDLFHLDLRLGQYDSVDLRGIPGEGDGDDTGFAVWKPAVTLPLVGNKRFPTDKLILATFDEFLQGTSAVQGVMYQVLQERRLGEFPLMPNVRLVCMSNREGDRGVQNRMSKPVANRVTHVEVASDYKAVCDYWAQIGMPAIGIAFFHFRHNLMNTFDPASPDKAFGTPRSNQKMLKFYASDMPAHVKEAAMAGAVGDGIAAEFWAFTETWGKMIKPADILKDPKGAKVSDDPAMNYAVAVAISGSMDRKTAAAFHTYLERMDPEYSVLAWQMAVKRDVNLFAVPEYISFSKRMKVAFSDN